jgi:hypothetical protein
MVGEGLSVANKPTYYELLKHPLWQRKRLEVLQREQFRCEQCEADDKMLHVHHTYYERGLKPWEYPTESLRALCADCHRKAQDWMTLLHREIGRLDQLSIERLVGYAMALQSGEFPSRVIELGSSMHVSQGVGDYWGLSEIEVWDAAEDGAVDGWSLEARQAFKAGRPSVRSQIKDEDASPTE